MTELKVGSWALARISGRCLRANPKLWVVAMPLAVGVWLSVGGSWGDTFAEVINEMDGAVAASRCEKEKGLNVPECAALRQPDATATEHSVENTPRKTAADAVWLVVWVFLSAAVTAAALRALRGEPIGIIDSYREAAARWRSLAVFGAIMASVDIVTSLMANQSALKHGALFVSFLWMLLTYLGIPILVRENRDGWEAIKRALRLVRTTWQQRVRFTLWILGVVVLAAVLLSISMALILVEAASTHSFAIGQIASIIFGAIVHGGFIFIYLIDQVATAALYTLAVEGALPIGADTRTAGQKKS